MNTVIDLGRTLKATVVIHDFCLVTQCLQPADLLHLITTVNISAEDFDGRVLLEGDPEVYLCSTGSTPTMLW